MSGPWLVSRASVRGLSVSVHGESHACGRELMNATDETGLAGLYTYEGRVFVECKFPENVVHNDDVVIFHRNFWRCAEIEVFVTSK